MAIEDDLLKIKEIQESFKKDNGAFFEMDWAQHKISIPKEGDALALRKIKRLVRTDAKESVFPAKDITEIAFEPSAKDYRFTIGRGIRRDNTGELSADCWYCMAIQKKANNIIDVKVIKGGDEDLLKVDGLFTE